MKAYEIEVVCKGKVTTVFLDWLPILNIVTSFVFFYKYDSTYKQIYVKTSQYT